MNKTIISNYLRLKSALFFLPAALSFLIATYLYCQNAFSIERYIDIQKDCFYYLNFKLSQFPKTQYNFTQFGDAVVILSFFALVFVSAPKIWEALISGSLISCLFSNVLKKIFAVPRPAAVFDNDSFVIIGKTLAGYNSVPSGHSITIFTTLTILMYSYSPSKLTYKILWLSFLSLAGLIFILSRVGVGAHYPIDVIIGGIVGYISGLLGIFFSLHFKIWNWIGNRKYYPFFIMFFLAGCVSLISRIINENLIIFYFALISLVFSLYKIITAYVKK
ncbi:phosphatase PAP2 family protein [Elizabethkingia miricola]|uniref:phosphatase PAP2 family protein n=1 Tax=Elizabethkingia miricola TaxID=172045 RepID=UPI0007417BB9|nr:phosphatase PAP2 family protein [Elizabethkingia miricola]KUG13334.1 phosphoesterase [Elizabethkingia miricola]